MSDLGQVYTNVNVNTVMSGVDPGFPERGAPTLQRGHQQMILPNFPKICIKSRNFWAVGDAPLRSATGCH